MKISAILMLVVMPVFSSCSTTGQATAEEQQTMRALGVQREQALALGNDTTAIDNQIAALDTTIAERTVGGVIDFIDAFVPVPLAPYKAWLAGLGGALLFKRPRKRLKGVAKAVGKMDVKGAGSQALALVGLRHSSTDPMEIMAGAAAQARKSGDEALAKKIEAAIS